MSKISIVVPVYWNSDTLMLLYEDMKAKILDKLGDYELVFVDDGSGDNSWEIMNQIRDMDSHVQCVKLSRNFGEHAALLAGLSVCTGDCAVTKQADLQEDSEIILEMYESWKRGNKVVLAVRKDRDENPVKVFFANMYCYLLDRQVIQVLQDLNEKNSSLTLQVLWAGFQTDHVYFHRRDREVGESRWTFSKKFKLVLDSMMSFSYFPIRMMSIVGVIFNILAVLMFIYVLVEKFTVGTPIAGWSSLMCVVLLSSGLILLTLGILGAYVWRALDAARTRPPFIIDIVKKATEEE